LSNFPYPINIGRIAGNHAQDPQTTYTADAEMDNVAIYSQCLADGEGKAEDAVLLPINERKWRVPRAARDKYGFGRSNVWYADYEQSEKVKPWVEDIIEKISNYDGDNIIDEDPEILEV
jgi:hypothetical protein